MQLGTVGDELFIVKFPNVIRKFVGVSKLSTKSKVATRKLNTETRYKCTIGGSHFSKCDLLYIIMLSPRNYLDRKLGKCTCR
jgi:hypothetical protein